MYVNLFLPLCAAVLFGSGPSASDGTLLSMLRHGWDSRSDSLALRYSEPPGGRLYQWIHEPGQNGGSSARGISE